MKAVENIGFFNASEYHKRFVRLDYGTKSELMFFDSKADSNSFPYKTHKQSELIRCCVLEDADIEARVEERKTRRSKSFMNRFTRAKSKHCAWNFAFVITFPQK